MVLTKEVVWFGKPNWKETRETRSSLAKPSWTFSSFTWKKSEDKGGNVAAQQFSRKMDEYSANDHSEQV